MVCSYIWIVKRSFILFFRKCVRSSKRPDLQIGKRFETIRRVEAEFEENFDNGALQEIGENIGLIKKVTAAKCQE